MRYPHISKLDLDLLVHLAVLLEERHVTRAANRCFLSQSAMSRQLERLREALGDELLLRTGRLHERTARGEQLLRELEPLLPRIEGILQGRSFDPAKSKDQFQVTMTDYACMVLLPELVKRTTKLAPNCSIDVQGWSEHSFDDLRKIGGLFSRPRRAQLRDDRACLCRRKRRPHTRRRPRQHHAHLVDQYGDLGGSSLLGKQRLFVLWRERCRCPDRRERLSRRTLSCSAELGGTGVSQAHSLQQAPQGRALCGLGTAEALFRRGSGGLQIITIGRGSVCRIT